MTHIPYRLGFIGAGKLAGSVIRGLLLKKSCTPRQIVACEPNEETRTRLEKETGISVTTENVEVVNAAEIIFLGLKPQMVLPVLRELGDSVKNKQVVSFAAGVRIASMEGITPARIMRVMTNTPGAIGRAATAFAAGNRTSADDREKILALFSQIGVIVEVSDEQIDTVTALAGSGPAFVYTVIEALARGAEQTGLPFDAALRLAAQTSLGAAELMLTSGKSPADLVKMVVTPGGTTAAGLEEMEKRSASAALSAAIAAATKRGREMARENQ